MKDLVISFFATVILILLFSALHFPGDMLPTGNGPKYPGEAGVVLPGNGAEPADVVMPESQQTTERAAGEEKSPPIATEETHTETAKEGKSGMNEMNEIVLAFWHGVATTLIGETVALLVATAWLKIRRAEHGKS